MTLYLYIPYSDKDEAKELGARWDAKEKSWYIPDEIESYKFNKWLNNIFLEPTEAFRKDLLEHGCILKSDEPICDGRSHRIMVEGDRQGTKSGFYVMHLDGVPNGYFINNRNKDTFKKTYYQNRIYKKESEEVIKKRHEEIKLKQQQEIALKKQEEIEVAEKLRRKISVLPNTLSIESPYFKKKQIEGSKYTYIEFLKRKNETGEYVSQSITYIPMYNVDGKITTVQYIDPEGNKRFVKNGQKRGTMHVVDGKITKQDRYIIICEGYATAATIQEEVNNIENYRGITKVVAAMDAGNISNVAKALKDKYPDKLYVIAADNDRFSKVNVGVQEANKVAEDIGAVVIVPEFSQNIGTDYNDLRIYDDISILEKQLQQLLLN